MTTEQQMRAVKLDGLVALVSRLPKRYTVYPNGDYSRYSATGMSNIDPRLGKLVGRNGNSISSYTTNRSLPVVIDTVQLPDGRKVHVWSETNLPYAERGQEGIRKVLGRAGSYVRDGVSRYPFASTYPYSRKHTHLRREIGIGGLIIYIGVREAIYSGDEGISMDPSAYLIDPETMFVKEKLEDTTRVWKLVSEEDSQFQVHMRILKKMTEG